MAVKIDRDKNVDRSIFPIEMSDGAELFSEMLGKSSTIDPVLILMTCGKPYRDGNYYKSNSWPVIIPAIVINWLKDEAC